MKRFLTAPVVAVALVLCVSAGARANMLPPSQVSWTYSFTPVGMPQNTAYSDGGTSGGVTFTAQNPATATGNSTVVLTNLRTFSNALPGSPDTLNTNGAYTIQMTIGTSANGSPMSGTLTFTGKLGGTFSSESADVTNVWNNPVQSLTLGAYTFNVELKNYAAPGDPSDPNNGAIQGFVTLGSIQTAGVPEPSTMLLSSFGLMVLGGAAWRKRRQGKVAVSA